MSTNQVDHTFTVANKESQLMGVHALEPPAYLASGSINSTAGAFCTLKSLLFLGVEGTESVDH
jgi:hypothetical protein